MDTNVKDKTAAIIRLLHGLTPEQTGEVLCRVAASFARVSAPNVAEAQLFAQQLEGAIVDAWKFN